MEQKKINKIAVIALLFALIATTQTSAIKTALNYTFHAGDNITIIDDGIGNVTISAYISSISDDLKLNKSGDTMTGDLRLSSGTVINSLDNPSSQFMFLGSGNILTSSDSSYNVSYIITSPQYNLFTSSTYPTNGNMTTLYQYSSNFKFNGGDLDISNYNITNCKNCYSNNSLDRKLSNYTNNYNWVNNSTMAQDNTKVNKSGDNITGAMPQIRGLDNATIGVNGWNNLNGLGGNFIGSSFTTLVTNRLYNESTGSYYNATYANATGQGLAVFSGSLTTSPAILFYSFAKNQTSYSYQGKIENTGWSVWMGNFTVNSLSGTGNANAYFDSTGKLSRNNTAGAGIPITSPDGTARCLRVDNLGTITALAGSC